MNKQRKKTHDPLNAWFLVVITYLSIVNLFVLKTSPEIITLQFAMLIIIFKKSRSKQYLKTWLPFIAIFLGYEFLRGIIDDISPFYSNTLYWVYQAENYLFKKLPTIYLQEIFLDNKLVLNISLFFYTTFFYYSFLVGLLIWLKKPSLFKKYSRVFLAMSYISLIFFFLIPTAPPWFVANELGIDIKRSIFNETILDHLSVFSLYEYFIYNNPVAAMPSLHTAWPAFTSLFLIKEFNNKFYYLFLTVPLMIGFSVVLTGEHFLLDVIAGWILVIVILKTSDKLLRVDKLKSLA